MVLLREMHEELGKNMSQITHTATGKTICPAICVSLPQLT